jgi:hypothetical protein
MKTAIKNLNIEAGTTYRRVLRFFTNKERTEAMDLTGFTIASWITKGTFKIEFAVSIGNDPTDGEAEMLLEPEQTADVLPGEYVWDMLIRDADGNVKKAMKGVAVIHPTGTKLPTNE